MSRLRLKVKVPNDGKLVVQLPGEYADREVDVEIDEVQPLHRPNLPMPRLSSSTSWRNGGLPETQTSSVPNAILTNKSSVNGLVGLSGAYLDSYIAIYLLEGREPEQSSIRCG